MNRPFFRSGQDVRESIFSQINQLSRSVFCFFSSRKENAPLSFLSRRKNVLLLFFLEEKKQKKIKFGRVASLFFCRFRQRGIQNGRFVCEPSVFSFRAGREGKRFFQTNHLSCNVFCFFSSRKENVPLSRKEIVLLQKKKKPCLGFLLLTILDRFSACVVRYGCSAWLSLQRRAEERRCGRA